MSSFSFGDKLRSLIEDSGIEVPKVQIVQVGNSKVSLKFTGTNSEIEAILESLRNPPTREELETLEKDGIEINFENEEGCAPYSKDIITTDNGLFYKGRRVVLHIAEAYYKNTPSTPVEKLHKYHLHYCQALQEQKAKGNLEKYRVSLSKDGKFHYSFKGRTVEKQKLNVCQACLRDFYSKEEFDKIGVKKKTYIQDGETKIKLDVSDFSLQNFLASQPETVQAGDSPKFLFDGLNVDGMDIDYLSLPTDYRKNWREISIERKKAENYTCQECGWKPTQPKEKKYIHTHHMDKNKNNNLSSNLKVLCIKCHFNYHPSLKEKSKDYKMFVDKIGSK